MGLVLGQRDGSSSGDEIGDGHAKGQAQLAQGGRARTRGSRLKLPNGGRCHTNFGGNLGLEHSSELAGLGQSLAVEKESRRREILGHRWCVASSFAVWSRSSMSSSPSSTGSGSPGRG